MINATNPVRKDKPRRVIGNAAETMKLLASVSPHLPGRPAPDLPRRGGAWLFRRNDAEAGWRHWEITELRRGLSRRYRDARFDVLGQLYDVISGLDPSMPSDERL